ncbi:hypothetical protein CC86DRAFT_180357 [Ophiobolus disseminans]|uniref:DUF1996 domain-containing protein n=1 Tax=Ophiobolus disseminans TaxID=1469910 RepID=A0A6A7A9V1_9PLEO|nr:hypothetical protein CC86DRAFT_180357 [Ophiobolus disseminans]
MLTNFVALTAGLAATTSAFNCNGNYFSFFNRAGPALSYQRLDPSLFPGTTSPHLHAFDGGNGLGAATSYKNTQDSTCSTARIKSDKSLYWRPSLFWNGNNTGFYRVPEKNSKIYYKFGDGEKWANVTGFPEDFNMMAGNPTKRADGDNPAGVRWGCHQPDGREDKIFSNGFPKGFQSCKYGFASEVTFPSCWNGEKTDPKDPHAHMAYPNGYNSVGIENCPTTHRAARFPTIFVEFWYDISSFDGQYSADSTPWVVSNGDPTGFGFHADFLNGWEKGVLEKATQEKGGCNCGCGCGQTEMEQCFGAENVNKDSDSAFQQCKVTAANSNEASPLLDILPGCNPLQSGPADATAASGTGCTAVPVAGGDKTPAAASKTPVVTPSPSGKVSSKVDAASSKIVKDDVSLAISIPSKQQAKPTPVAASEQYGASPSSAVAPTPSVGKPDAPKGDLSSLTIATTPAASKPSGTPGTGKDEDCKAPVYVTITPTIYVTAGSNSTSCGMGTVTKTMTQTATVTVPAQGGFEYGSY